jgi:TRAP transporter TAXI family solute receptor
LTRPHVTGLAATAILLLATCIARAQEPRIMVTLGTATPGGGFPVYGQAVAETINGIDPSLELKTRNTKGSTENVPLLEAGQLDLGLVQGEVAHEALSGVGRPASRLMIHVARYTTPGMFVVRADQPYRGIADLKGKTIAWGARGSGLVVLARYVLDGLGLDMARDFQSIYLDQAGDGPAMVMDGRAAALWGGGSGWPGFTAVARGPQGARFIGPTAEERTRIQAKHAFLRTLTIPAGSYPGQAEAIVSVGSWSFILARPDLPEETAYRLARALHRGEPALAARLPLAIETTAVNTVAAAPRPDLIHPGARRYFREAGLLH